MQFFRAIMRFFRAFTKSIGDELELRQHERCETFKDKELQRSATGSETRNEKMSFYSLFQRGVASEDDRMLSQIVSKATSSNFI